MNNTKKISIVGTDKVIIVDDDDYIRFGAFNWYPNDKGYIITDVSKHRKSDYGSAKVRLHRLIMACPNGMDVDHANGDKLDNRKENLRICTRSENLCNKEITNNLMGAYYRSECCRKPWFSAITFNGKQKYLGSFYTAEEAHEMYKKESIRIHGKYSRFKRNTKQTTDENKQ